MTWKAFIAWVSIYIFLLGLAWLTSDAAMALVVIFLAGTQIIEIRERAIFGPFYDPDDIDDWSKG